MTGRSGRGQALGYAVVAVAFLVVVIWQLLLPMVEIGDIDPSGTIIGSMSLVVTCWTAYLAVRSLRWQETNTADLAERLADRVRTTEADARAQLLGRRADPIDIDLFLQPARARGAARATSHASLGDIVDYTRLRPGRMVITGAGGSGKTVLAVQLILGLLDKRQPGEPVPVRLSAASWSTDTAEPVYQWLTDHLIGLGFSRASARALLDAEMILPVIDGVDEMDVDATPGYASRAGKALRALDAYQDRRTRAGLVLICRSGQDRALKAVKVWIRDAAHVRIRPVDAARARAFITARALDVARWQPVLAIIDHHPNHPLTQALSTPWRLMLAVTAYEHRHPSTGAFLREPAELTDPSLTADALRDRLLALFIPAATAPLTDPTIPPTDAADETEPLYPPERVHRWLAVLASYLHRNSTSPQQVEGRVLSGTNLVPHELWPLAGTRLPVAIVPATLGTIWLTMLATATVILAARPSIQIDLVLVVILAIPFTIALGIAAFIRAETWPEPSRLNLGRLRTRRGRRRLAIGVVAGLAVGLIAGFTTEPVPGLGLGLCLALTLGPTFGLMTEGTVGVTDPRGTVRDDLAATALIGMPFGLMTGLAVGLGSGFLPGPAAQIGYGLAAGFTAVLVAPLLAGPTIRVWAGPFGAAATVGRTPGLAGLRYVAFLLCTRRWSGRWLPWRLGRFLHWCYRKGLLRIAGTGYQFRHQELQDYLARHPTR